MTDKLTEIEQIEYYRKRLISQKSYGLIVCILMFIAGFVIDRFVIIPIRKI
jgi:ABC-type transport system involved in cytochrome bd biosynthesis fused ATPase/permease subunit